VTPSNQPSDWQAEWSTRNVENKRIGTEKKLEPAE
jgi:formate dehydrogenase major subunit